MTFAKHPSKSNGPYGSCKKKLIVYLNSPPWHNPGYLRQYRVRRFLALGDGLAQQPRVVVGHVLFLRTGNGVVMLQDAHRFPERRDFRFIHGARQTLHGQLFARLKTPSYVPLPVRRDGVVVVTAR